MRLRRSNRDRQLHSPLVIRAERCWQTVFTAFACQYLAIFDCTFLCQYHSQQKYIDQNVSTSNPNRVIRVDIFTYFDEEDSWRGRNAQEVYPGATSGDATRDLLEIPSCILFKLPLSRNAVTIFPIGTTFRAAHRTRVISTPQPTSHPSMLSNQPTNNQSINELF